MYSLRKFSLILVILAAALLQTNSEETDVEETQPEASLRCESICGEDEGELEDPSKVIKYQWNYRIPVCSGLSCLTGSCSFLEDMLANTELSEFECAKHKRSLQVEGCTCSKVGVIDVKPMETKPVDAPTKSPFTSNSADAYNGGAVTTSEKGVSKEAERLSWIIFGCLMGGMLVISFLFWLGIRYDDNAAALENAEEESADEEP